ncbi:hypothetical protein NPIL_237041 [Nephila pilipes]|uniref:Uncharacterized protein n=1 Tax=Nephila pilipes TaxID=299642 RepID=A0A8X6Q042_NEPPI|nr:hypothetical protein NPIL_237041 [Nephila pilipes]
MRNGLLRHMIQKTSTHVTRSTNSGDDAACAESNNCMRLCLHGGLAVLMDQGTRYAVQVLLCRKKGSSIVSLILTDMGGSVTSVRDSPKTAGEITQKQVITKIINWFQNTVPNISKKKTSEKGKIQGHWLGRDFLILSKGMENITKYIYNNVLLMICIMAMK